jgi:hypothetical protein
MTDSKINGGPAFPSTMTDDSLHVPGMTLRDYFAAKVLVGLLSTNGSFAKATDLARVCYQLSDEMLKARELTP